jgi:hypothetical protein
MNRASPIVVLLAVFAATATAMASVYTITFEGLADGEQIGNYYAGGLGGNGSGPGPNFGVTFAGNSGFAIISASSGGSGSFANNPSGDTVAYFLAAAPTMNVSGGFVNSLAFFYSDYYIEGMVAVYDGLNGTGNVLASHNLATTPMGSVDTPYDYWQNVSLAFNGTAQSVVFSAPSDQSGLGLGQVFGLDDVSLGQPNGAPAVPEPAAIVIWLLLAGLGIAGYCRRGRKRPNAVG